jgi:diguanylate cyclase (GGDEF)-like protein
MGAERDHASDSRLIWLILEAVGSHAVEADPAEREAFRSSLRELVTKMEQAESSDGTLVLVGEVIKSIETYNRGVQRSMRSRMTELQSIVSLFTRSMLQLSKGSTASGVKLRQIEHQIEKCSQAEDLRTLKSQLKESLETICEEAAGQERRSKQISDQLLETMSRPESAVLLEEACSDIDQITGLLNFRSAEQALRSAIATNAHGYAVLIAVERVEVINTRFGFAIGDRVLMLFGQHLVQRLSKNDRLFRWRGAGFLALLDRTGSEMSIRAEIARTLSPRMEQEIELSGRSVLLPINSSWMLTSLAGASMEKITQKLDQFSIGQSGANATPEK